MADFYQLYPHASALRYALTNSTADSKAFLELLARHDSDESLQGAGFSTRSLTALGQPYEDVEVRAIYRVMPGKQHPAPNVTIVLRMKLGAVDSLTATAREAAPL
jgi:hypothetical protein